MVDFSEEVEVELARMEAGGDASQAIAEMVRIGCLEPALDPGGNVVRRPARDGTMQVVWEITDLGRLDLSLNEDDGDSMVSGR